jgi:hypothetical protein
MRDDAMTRVEEHAAPDWKDEAFSVVIDLARTRRPFTADDVWERVGWAPHEPRALGPIMMRALREGYIRPTGHWVACRRVSRHKTHVKEWIGIV